MLLVSLLESKLMSNIAIPEHLRKYLANTQQNSEADSMASASLSMPRCSLRGRKFRLIEGGEEIRKPSDELICVILGVDPGPGLNIKTYYEKGYQSGDSSPPDCGSSDGIRPDAWVQNRQNDVCRTCRWNQFKSAPNGKGKACKDSKRLWIALPEDIEGTVFAMGVPVTSLKAMSEYGAMLKSNGVPPSAVLTRITMVDSEFPELQFEYLGVLEQSTLETAMLRNEKKDWSRPTGPMLEDQSSRGPIERPGGNAPVDQAKLLEGATVTKTSDPNAANAAADGW